MTIEPSSKDCLYVRLRPCKPGGVFRSIVCDGTKLSPCLLQKWRNIKRKIEQYMEYYCWMAGTEYFMDAAIELFLNEKHPFRSGVFWGVMDLDRHGNIIGVELFPSRAKLKIFRKVLTVLSGCV